MARRRSERVVVIKAELVARLREGAFLPGERFLSARQLSSDYGISYQTADRLLAELCQEGFVERRAASGTFVPGGAGTHESTALSEVRFLFASRARREQSFGARLLAGMTERLRRSGLTWQVSWSDLTPVEAISPEHFLVLWESPSSLEACRRLGRRALLLNARPEPGLDTSRIDSVSLDDYSGGVIAAELLLRRLSARSESRRGTVMTGPVTDQRSKARREGFLSRWPGASEVCAGGWYVEDGRRVAADALRLGMDGIFCVNDRLAEAVLEYCVRTSISRPPLIGFDDAPVAAVLDLTTIAIPWSELATDAAEIIRTRLGGDTSAARHRTIRPQPVLRHL